MTLIEAIIPNLPFLRRYARALAGSQVTGDALVAKTLEALVAAPDLFPNHIDARPALYSVFERVLESEWPEQIDGDPARPLKAAVADKRLAALTPLARRALLLTTLEGFSQEQAAQILGLGQAEIDSLVETAVSDIDRQTATSVLIIEDEPIIALDLEEIVRSLGHQVIGPVDTRVKAVRSAVTSRPGLVLADIQLADGSSGIDAANDILTTYRVPIIFITAYPERLLTGERPEPAFLITKPFQTDTVKAAISQALFFEQPALPAA